MSKKPTISLEEITEVGTELDLDQLATVSGGQRKQGTPTRWWYADGSGGGSDVMG